MHFKVLLLLIAAPSNALLLYMEIGSRTAHKQSVTDRIRRLKLLPKIGLQYPHLRQHRLRDSHDTGAWPCIWFPWPRLIALASTKLP